MQLHCWVLCSRCFFSAPATGLDRTKNLRLARLREFGGAKLAESERARSQLKVDGGFSLLSWTQYEGPH